MEIKHINRWNMISDLNYINWESLCSIYITVLYNSYNLKFYLNSNVFSRSLYVI